MANLFDIAVARKLSGGGGGGGSSDFSMATVTVTYPEGVFSDLSGAFISSNDTRSWAEVPSGGSAELILYKGKAVIYSVGSLPVLSTSGNIEYDSENDWYAVTGDCSITLGNYQ